MTKLQYRDIIAFADSMDLMAKALIYRKYRPNVPSYKGYYKIWWQFAYKCVLEEQVLRIRRNWSWSHIKNHRQLLKDYGQAYKIKLQNKKVIIVALWRLYNDKYTLLYFDFSVHPKF